MESEAFMREYLSRLAFGLAQFWPVDEELPDDEAHSDNAFYSGAIRRLNVFRRAELARMMWSLVEEEAKFFSECTSREKRVKTIRGIIERFPLLAEADHEITFKHDRI
jgi:hypothetical protein